MKVKQLAELQFDKSAAPVSLGFKFNSLFEDYQFDFDHVDDVEEYHTYDPPSLISNETESIECDPRSLVLLANDVHPDKRDEQAEKNLPFTVQDPVENQLPDNSDQPEKIDPSLPGVEFQSVNSDKPQFEINDVNNIDFQIANQQFRLDHIEGKAKFGNQAISAINLTLLAIDKFDDFERAKLKIEKDTSNKNHNFSTMLIDKSMSSIKFINKIGLRIQDQIESKYPDKFKKLNRDKQSDIQYLNQTVARTRLEHLYHYSILSKYIQYSHVELNSMPALDLGLRNNHMMITCHNLLRYLNFSTIHVDSITFRNIKNLVHNFPVRYSSTRLHYLEFLVSEIENGNLFFQSENVNFFERSDKRWNNVNFPGINKWINNWWETINQ